MQCSFCPNPAAHPATGCQYSKNMLACESCTKTFWSWLLTHTNKKARRASKAVPTALSFYEAAGKKP